MKPPDQLPLLFLLLVLTASANADPCARYPDAVNGTESDSDQCEINSSNFHLTCSGGLHDEWEAGSETVEILTLCGWPEKSLDPDGILTKFPALRSLSIVNSNFTKLSTAFPATAKYLQIVRINGTGLESIPEGAFSGLPALTKLDLRHNALWMVNHTDIEGPSLQEVYLSDNPWKCSIDMSWLLNVNDSVASRVIDRDSMTCRDDYRYHPFVPVVKITVELKEECARTTVCHCELSYVISPHRGVKGAPLNKFMVFVTVNCTSMGLTEFPKSFPSDTTLIDLSKNEINDLSPLATNPVYKGVRKVYLDDNKVESIAPLEGSDWLDHFQVLSLIGNRLTDLPEYVLENALLQNREEPRILLGNNPWRCDCLFTPGFQNLLRRHIERFKDYRNVNCSKVEHDENSGKQTFKSVLNICIMIPTGSSLGLYRLTSRGGTIMYLTRTAICTSPDDDYWIQPLDVLNGVLAFLILFIFGKLLYDYWNFKRTGKLPWIVAKIP